MSFEIENKLVIAVASSAVLTLDAAQETFRHKGIEAYRQYQREHQNDILERGPGFAFVKRLLRFNDIFPETEPVEVILLSHNDADTGLRIMKSLEYHGLKISRAAFITDDAPYKYLAPYNVSLFLSGNFNDVEEAIRNGFAAGTVLPSVLNDDEQDGTLRVAFDFDGVLTDGASEIIFQKNGLVDFQKNELEQAQTACMPGPLCKLFRQLAALRNLEIERQITEADYKRRLSLSIVTARSVPAHERVVTTLREWGINIDKTFFLGGICKGRILSVLQSHIFFDDQLHPHLDSAKDCTPCVHIPLLY